AAFSLPIFLADLAVLSAATALIVLLAIRHRRRRGAWIRFSLREMLAAITVASIVAAWWTRTSIQWQREQQLLPLYVYFDPFKEYAGPEWLRRLLPEDTFAVFERVMSISPDTEEKPELISNEPEQYEVRWTISSETIDKAQVVTSQLPQLR